MIYLPDLINAMVTTLSNIPALVAILAPVDPIVAYIDVNPTANSVDKAIYQIQPGQLLVVHTDTRLEHGTMTKWSHTIEICIRALPDQSDYDLVREVMRGVPTPGDGQIWLRCAILPGTLPTNVTNITRRTDTEGVDFWVVMTETAETGDWPDS